MGGWPEWRRERVWELWVEGYSLHAIAREVGMARDNVTAVLLGLGRATGAAQARRAVSVVGGARGGFARLGVW